MTSEEMFEDEFVINLTIDGTSYEDVDVKVTDPNKTIRDQIASIVQVFELPIFDAGGDSLIYMLGRITEDGEEPEYMELENEDGEDLTFIDYQIKNGDKICLTSFPAWYRKLKELTISNQSLPIKRIIKREMKQMGYRRYFLLGKDCRNKYFYTHPYDGDHIYSIILVSFKWRADKPDELFKDQINGIYKELKAYRYYGQYYLVAAHAANKHLKVNSFFEKIMWNLHLILN